MSGAYPSEGSRRGLALVVVVMATVAAVVAVAALVIVLADRAGDPAGPGTVVPATGAPSRSG
jgi:hypothetical protein